MFPGQTTRYSDGLDTMSIEEKRIMELASGTILNQRYRIVKKLGQGGFAITYLAGDLQLKKRVVIKEFFPYAMASRDGESAAVLPPEGELQKTYLKYKKDFLKEAIIQASLFEITGVVKVLGYFEENDTVYEVMEYVDGITLRAFLEEHGELLNFTQVWKQMLPVLEAVAAIHERGYVHRDISPDNIMVQKDGRLKLMDFGASRVYQTDTDRQKTMTVLIKDGFTPPEQYDSHGKQGPWTDIYALAAVFYYLLTGYTPESAMERQVQDTLFLPSEFGCEIPPETEMKLVSKGLSLNPKERYQSVWEMESDLVGAETQAPREQKRRKDFLPAAVLLAAAALCSVAAAAAFADSLHLEPPTQAQEYDRDSAKNTELKQYLEEHAASEEETEDGIVYQLKEADAEALSLTSDVNFLNLTREDLLSGYEKEGFHVETVSEKADLTVTEQYGTDTVKFLKTQRLSVPEKDCLVFVNYDLYSEKIHRISIRLQEDTEDLAALSDISNETLQIVQSCLRLPDSAREGKKEFPEDFSEMAAQIEEGNQASVAGLYLGRDAKLLMLHTDASSGLTVHVIPFKDGI